MKGDITMDQILNRQDFSLTDNTMFGHGWSSGEQKSGYCERAKEVLAQYRIEKSNLIMLEFELSEWKELKWEDVFHPEECLKGVRYDTDRVQSSNISDQPYQMVASAESKLERNEKQRTLILRDMERAKRKMRFSKKMLDVLKGNERKVAEQFWFQEQTVSVEEVALELMLAESTVKRIKAEAIETVALYLKQRDARQYRVWMA